MNREQLLGSIKASLEANKSSVDRLHRCATEIRRQCGITNPPLNTESSFSPEQVAAFVAGSLSTETAAGLLHDLNRDNFLLLEIISCVDAVETEASWDLAPSSLSQRIAGESQSFFAKPTLVSLQRLPSPELSKPRRWSSTAILALTACALLIIAIGITWKFLRDGHTSGAQVTNIPTVKSENEKPKIVEPAPLVTPDQAPVIADSSDVSPPIPSSEELESDRGSRSDIAVEQDEPEETELRNEGSIPLQNMEVEQPTIVAHALALGTLHAIESSGLVSASLPNDLSAELDRYSNSWKPVGQTGAIVDSKTGSRLLTLPATQAEAQFDCGARLVVASESELDLRVEDEATLAVNLRYGALALQKLPTGTRLLISSADSPAAEVIVADEADLLIGYMPDGFQLWSTSGTLRIGEVELKRRIASWSRNAQQELRLKERPTLMRLPGRMPAWVNRKPEKLEFPTEVLAQLSQGDNLLVNVEGVIESMQAASGQPAVQQQLALLARWQVLLSGSRSGSLVSHRLPVIRNAAIRHVVLLPAWDPRYEPTWAELENALGNPMVDLGLRENVQLQGFQAIAERVRSNEPLLPGQLEILMRSLSSRSLAGRAFSDFMLRHFRGNGPSFDPTWTGAALTRGVAQWRRFLQAN